MATKFVNSVFIYNAVYCLVIVPLLGIINYWQYLNNLSPTQLCSPWIVLLYLSCIVYCFENSCHNVHIS